MSTSASNESPSGSHEKTLENVSLLEIKDAIPRECFQPSLKLSFYYFFKDLSLIISCFLVMLIFSQYKFLFPLYWFLQGTFFWSLFVVGHDCGHSSFSSSETINFLVGLVSHSAIMVPFQPWRISHRLHHQNTNNIDKDEVFAPVRKPTTSKNGEGFKYPYFFGGFGFYVYLLFGFSPRNMNHFNPMEKKFENNRLKCLISNLGIALNLFLQYQCYQSFGFLTLLNYYLLPLWVFSFWLTMVTFLHHSDKKITWYGAESWSYVKGALSTVDRDYGIFHYLTHNIGTHQVHHLFSKIPHYRLEEATREFRKKFPQFVQINNETNLFSFHKNFWMYSEQAVIDSTVKIFNWK